MTDYTKSTGSSGTMMIRDTGTVVEFWIKAGTATFAYNMPWGYTVNGVTDTTNQFRFESGGAWQKIQSWTVTTDQTVSFMLYDTGTSGLGGPTTLTATIPRATVPDPPSQCSISAITSTSANVTFTDGSNGGAAIDSRQIGYGTSSTTVQTTVASDGSTTLTGLTPGTTYYVWARTHNSKGWSSYGARASFTTLRVPDAPTTPVLSEPTMTTVVATFNDNGNGGTSITSRQLGWNTTNTTPSTTMTSDGSTTITGLLPGTTYYVWARVQNSVGWSAWSAVASVQTVAGVWVKSGGSWKKAVPYVRSGGVWKVAEPWVKHVGFWKKTS